MRPRIVPGTPLKYKELMKQCWDVIPSKRPDRNTLWNEINKIYNSYLNEKKQQQTNNNNTQLNTSINTSSGSIGSLARKFSQIHIFEGLPEPRNATKGMFLKFFIYYI